MWPVDDDWKRSVIALMKEKGFSRTRLAKETDSTQGAITNLLKLGPGTTKQSRLVPKVHKALGMATTTAPAVAIDKDDAYRRLMKAWPRMTVEERDLLVLNAELATRRR